MNIADLFMDLLARSKRLMADIYGTILAPIDLTVMHWNLMVSIGILQMEQERVHIQ